MIDKATMKIIATAFAKRHTRDFRLFKESNLNIDESIYCLADAGHQGLMKLHGNSKTPHKKSKHHPLTAEQKEENRTVSGQRIICRACHW